MKKLFALLCVMTVFFTGCQAEENKNRETTTQDAAAAQPVTTTQSTSLYTGSLADKVDSYVDSGGTSDEAANGQGGSQAGTSAGNDVGQTGSTQSAEDDRKEGQTADFEERDDTVYATTNVVVRNKPSLAGDPVMNLKKGNSIHRVGYSAGWTKVEVKGYFYYIATQYLSETP